MDDLNRLIDAASKGALEEVRAIVASRPEIAREKDREGATALHYAVLGGHRAVAKYLVEQRAEINAADDSFRATPAGWAIEYLREMGGFLGIELDDFAHAIRRGDAHWVKRFLTRFPALRNARDPQGRLFKEIAVEAGDEEIVEMLEAGQGAGESSG